MLDEKQQEFIGLVKNGEPQIFVEAPAGTGKTFCCIQATKTICDLQAIQPFQKILILTFSRNARAQLLKELSKIPRDSNVHKQVNVNNYHSFFKRYLDAYRDMLGILQPLTVTEDEDFLTLLREFASEHDRRWTHRIGTSVIDDYYLVNNELLLINDQSKYKRISEKEKIDFLKCVSSFTRNTGHICFAQFGYLACEILDSSEQLARAISHDYPVLILDEYQDTNYFQEKFVSKILENSKGIFFADKWQMIYGFRGSVKKRLEDLPVKYPSIRKVSFETYYRYRNMQDITEILNTIRTGGRPDYSILVNGEFFLCDIRCNTNWQVLKGTSNKSQCTIFSKSVFFKIAKEVGRLLKQRKSVLILCRRNAVVNRLTEIFYEKKYHPRSISDTVEMVYICKHIKNCLGQGTVRQHTGSILAIVALSTMSKKIDGEAVETLCDIDSNKLARKKKPLLKQIYSIIEPFLDFPVADHGLQLVKQINEKLSTHESISINFSRNRFIDHCTKVENLTPALVESIMLQRQYIDSFTDIKPGLYITTVHQSKGKEFDCVFIVDIDDIATDSNLMYVANSRMKERLYPIKINYLGVRYNRR